MSQEPQDQNLTVLDILTQKDVTDAIFKNLTWYLACAAILKFTVIAAKGGQIILTIGLLLLFIFLFALNIIFGAKNILLPIDNAFGNAFAKIKRQNTLPNQSDLNRLKRTLFYILALALAGSTLLSHRHMCCWCFIWSVLQPTSFLLNETLASLRQSFGSKVVCQAKLCFRDGRPETSAVP